MAEYYHKSLVNEDLTVVNRSNKTYGEHAPVLTKETMQKWANHVGDSATNKDKVQHSVWIISAPNCAIPYVYYGRYLAGNEMPDTYQIRKPWKNSVEILQMETPVSSSGFKSYKILVVTSLQKIEQGEELLVQYGSGNPFMKSK